MTLPPDIIAEIRRVAETGLLPRDRYAHHDTQVWAQSLLDRLEQAQAEVPEGSITTSPAPTAKRNEKIDAALDVAANILLNFKTEGNRTKYDELESCYACLFTQFVEKKHNEKTAEDNLEKLIIDTIDRATDGNYPVIAAAQAVYNVIQPYLRQSSKSDGGLAGKLKDAAHVLPGFNDEMVHLNDAIDIVRQHQSAEARIEKDPVWPTDNWKEMIKAAYEQWKKEQGNE